MQHPYENNYDVLPQLRKLGDRPIFQVTPDLAFFLEEKEKAIESQICFGEHYMRPEIYTDICEFIVDNYPVKLEKPYTFDNLAMQMQEDIAIHRLAKDVDWLAAAFICFPNMWRVEDKIGRDFNEIYAPISKMQLKKPKTREMLEAAIAKGPFERFVWSPVFDRERINYHPRTPKKKFKKEDPCIHCKVERQVIIGFPKHNALLFAIRQFIIPQEKLDLEAMYDAIKDMGIDFEKYYGIFADFFQLKNFLKEEAGIEMGFHVASHHQQHQTGKTEPASQGPPPFKDWDRPAQRHLLQNLPPSANDKNKGPEDLDDYDHDLENLDWSGMA